jgi:uncharacterized phage protein (TIGR02218 family)
VGLIEGNQRLRVQAAELAQAGLFTRGRLDFTSGQNAGARVMIKEHRAGGMLTLWQEMPLPIALGDTLRLVAGCDKRFETCRARFANALNFRGFPFIPDPNFVVSYARSGEGMHQGRPLVRV